MFSLFSWFFDCPYKDPLNLNCITKISDHEYRELKSTTAYMNLTGTKGMFIFPTRFECSFTSSPLVTSVFLHLLDSFRVCLLRRNFNRNFIVINFTNFLTFTTSKFFRIDFPDRLGSGNSEIFSLGSWIFWDFNFFKIFCLEKIRK